MLVNTSIGYMHTCAFSCYAKFQKNFVDLPKMTKPYSSADCSQISVSISFEANNSAHISVI